LVGCDDGTVGVEDLPEEVRATASLKLRPGRFTAREARVWLVDWQGTLGLLRRLEPAIYPHDQPGLLDDLAWQHDFLSGLAGSEVATPRPLPAFDGRSLTVIDGAVWELVSYLPGRDVGWDAAPPMREIGSLLARYHIAVAATIPAVQRPLALPLARVADVLRDRARAVLADAEIVRLITTLADELAQQLADLGTPTDVLVVHGDFTTHNVIAKGAPPRAYGVIDFALAHAERAVADIGYGLWRSGRPHQEATWLDLGRVTEFIGGYTEVRAADVTVVPIHIQGRGLQILAKRLRARSPDLGPLTQIQWLRDNRSAVEAAVAHATS
jgi:Ser/Thr protein kinase RdoA (MazF antagonist)